MCHGLSSLYDLYYITLINSFSNIGSHRCLCYNKEKESRDFMQFQDFNLKQELLRSLKKLNYQTPLPIQQQVIPYLLNHQDIVIESQTGSGKSASFLIPIIENIDWDLRAVQALVIAPTRELSVQLIEEADAIGLYRRIQSVLLNGREKYEPQIQRLKRAQLAIGTPGRILDHIERESLCTSHIQYVILDEADVLLDMGFLPLIKKILTHLPNSCVIGLCSATMEESLQTLVEEYMHDPIYIKNHIQNDGILTQYVCHIRDSEKYPFLCNYVVNKQAESVIVFCNTKDSVENLYQRMLEDQISVTRLHGDLLQKERYQAIEAFRKGEYRFLIASDVAGRGLDIEEVQLVIQYDLHEDPRKYIHRIGRSGRCQTDGESIVLLTKSQEKYFEEVLKQLPNQPEEICVNDYLGNIEYAKLQKPNLQKRKKSEIVRDDVCTLYLHGGKDKKIRPGDIVGAIMQTQGIEVNDIGVIEVKQHGSYVEILNQKGSLVLETLKKVTIKKKKIRVEYARKSKMER